MKTGTRVVLAAVTALSSLLVGTPAMAASVGCGSACDGKNPATYQVTIGGVTATCASDAETVRRTYEPSTVDLELRYSPRCRTAWVRLGSDFHYPTIKSYYTDGRLRTSYSGFVGAYYSQMVNDKGFLAQGEAYAGGGTWFTDKY